MKSNCGIEGLYGRAEMPVFIENVAHLSVINEISGEVSDIVDLSYELNTSDFLADRQKIQTNTLKAKVSQLVWVFLVK